MLTISISGAAHPEQQQGRQSGKWYKVACSHVFSAVFVRIPHPPFAKKCSLDILNGVRPEKPHPVQNKKYKKAER